MRPFAALPLLALAGCSVCQPTRFTWPVFDDPIAVLIADSDSSTQSRAAPASITSITSGSTPSAPVSEQPSAPAAETPSTSTETASTSTETASTSTETPTTQAPSAPASPSTGDGVGGQQETREESHDRG